MSDQREKNRDGESAPESGGMEANSDLKRLKELLLGKESRQIDVLQEHLENPELHASDVGRVLHQAVQVNQKQQPGALADALAPTVESSLYASVRKNPDQLGDALFPVMMPAIRKAIISIMHGMVQSLNYMLENSFSLQGLRWRLKSIQTGKSFAEIVMLHTLTYRVEQVFLIHKADGLLLQHVSFLEGDTENADLVSSMLTAIQDFVRDSFQVESSDSIEKLNIGNMVVYIEAGSKVVLAAVVRGNAPAEFNEMLQQRCESIHKHMATELDDFDGDASVFNTVRPEMESCLLSQTASPTSGSNLKAKLMLVALALTLLGWSAWGWYQNEREQQLVRALDTLPGFVVIHHSHEEGSLLVSGLRDPLSDESDKLLHTHGFSKDDVTLKWTPYQSLETDILLRRVKLLLKPDAKTELKLDDSTLTISGVAQHAWLDRARDMLPALPGISEIVTDELVFSDSPEYLLRLAIKELQPPATVHLSIADGVLIAEGKAPHAWLNKAATVTDLVPEIREYNGSALLDMDSDDYLLRESTRLLNPPSSVRLRVQQGTLIATGKASQQWVERATTATDIVSGIKAYNGSGLVNTQSDAYLLSESIRLLRPPSSVHLSVNQALLVITGKASSRWQKKAGRALDIIPGINGYDYSNLEIIHSDAYLLRKSIRLLKPPSSVRLSVRRGRLTAKGEAPNKWISNARKRAKRIAGIIRFDTKALIDTGSNAYLLAKIRRELQTPESVILELNKRELIISGFATAAWIEKAAKLILRIDGVDTIWQQDLVVAEKVLASLKTRLLNTNLHFSAHSSQLMDGETSKIERLASLLIKQSELIQSTQGHVQITGYSRLLGAQAKVLAFKRAEKVKRELIKYGVNYKLIKISGYMTRNKGWAARLDLMWSPLP